MRLPFQQQQRPVACFLSLRFDNKLREIITITLLFSLCYFSFANTNVVIRSLSRSPLFTFRCLLWWCVHRKRYSWNQSDDVMPVYTRVKRRIQLEARNNYLFNWISNVSKTNMLNSHWAYKWTLLLHSAKLQEHFLRNDLNSNLLNDTSDSVVCFCVAQKTILITTFECNWIDRKVR